MDQSKHCWCLTVLLEKTNCDDDGEDNVHNYDNYNDDDDDDDDNDDDDDYDDVLLFYLS